MTQSALAALPTAQELEEGAKSILAVGAVLGGAWAICRRWYRRRRAASQMRELESKAIRYLLDAQRHTLNVIVPHEDRRVIDVDELIRQKLLIDQIRDRLWRADGHSQAAIRDIVNVLTRTQAIRMKEQELVEAPQDMFREDEKE